MRFFNLKLVPGNIYREWLIKLFFFCGTGCVGHLIKVDVQELVCVAGAWKERRKERTGAREGDTQGEREPLSPRVSPSRAPLFSCAHYFQAPATQAVQELHYT